VPERILSIYDDVLVPGGILSLGFICAMAAGFTAAQGTMVGLAAAGGLLAFAVLLALVGRHCFIMRRIALLPRPSKPATESTH
jgi:hypothetical protein